MRMILIVIGLQIIAKIIFAQLEMSHILIAMQMNSGLHSTFYDFNSRARGFSKFLTLESALRLLTVKSRD